MTQSPVQHALVEHRRWLATVLRARGVEASAVEELLQEVSAAAVERASRLRDPSKVAPWLYRIAVVTALQHRRRLGRKRKLEEKFAATQAATSVSAEPDPLAWLLADEQRSLVRQAIASLPAKDAEILLLKHTADWSSRQLSQHLGISESAVDARLNLARKRIRSALA